MVKSTVPGQYEAPQVKEIGALKNLTLGASGPGVDFENCVVVPGSDYTPNK